MRKPFFFLIESLKGNKRMLVLFDETMKVIEILRIKFEPALFAFTYLEILNYVDFKIKCN